MMDYISVILTICLIGKGERAMNMQKDIYLIIIGAAIGFISSIGTIIFAELLKKQGKLKIYYKIVFSKFNERETWGFHNGSDGLTFEVPLWIEIQNTSNVARVVRDFNILLFKDGKELTRMMQINKTKDESFGNEGGYSFVIQPRSLTKYDLHFCIKKNQMGENYQFDEIRLRYFDEKDKVHIFPLNRIERCWELGSLLRDGIWKLAKV
jgi:hypothetical protein